MSFKGFPGEYSIFDFRGKELGNAASYNSSNYYELVKNKLNFLPIINADTSINKPNENPKLKII